MIRIPALRVAGARLKSSLKQRHFTHSLSKDSNVLYWYLYAWESVWFYVRSSTEFFRRPSKINLALPTSVASDSQYFNVVICLRINNSQFKGGVKWLDRTVARIRRQAVVPIAAVRSTSVVKETWKLTSPKCVPCSMVSVSMSNTPNNTNTIL